MSAPKLEIDDVTVFHFSKKKRKSARGRYAVRGTVAGEEGILAFLRRRGNKMEVKKVDGEGVLIFTAKGGKESMAIDLGDIEVSRWEFISKEFSNKQKEEGAFVDIAYRGDDDDDQ